MLSFQALENAADAEQLLAFRLLPQQGAETEDSYPFVFALTLKLLRWHERRPLTGQPPRVGVSWMAHSGGLHTGHTPILKETLVFGPALLPTCAPRPLISLPHP